MSNRKNSHRRTVHGAVIRMVACIAFLVLASSTALANQAGTPAPDQGTPVVPVGPPLPPPGPPQYPDLVALPPNDLYFSTEILADGQEHLLLRFTSSVANAGEGPLELAGNTNPGSAGDVFQVVYDANGQEADRIHLGTDLIYHPEHHHFHLANFATFELLHEEPDGTRVPTGEGGKQSSCLLDTLPVDETLRPKPTYKECELQRQGISVGWRDAYAASLPDQWVDLGSGPIADGMYILRYVVDPPQQLAEDGRTDNNVAETRFEVRDGQIVGRPEPPRCAIEGSSSGPAGSTVSVNCSHFPKGSRIDVYWGAWDPWDASMEPIATFRSEGEAPSTGTFEVPNVAAGSYPVALVSPDYRNQVYVSATVIYGVEPAGATPSASPADGHDHSHG